MKNPARAHVGHVPSLIVVLALALLFLAPAIAVAKQSSTTTPTADWAFIDIGAQYDQGQSYCLVGGELPTETPLPVAVKLPVPGNSQPQWVGEIAQSPSGTDQQLPYTVEKRGSMDVYAFTLTKSRLGQVEILTSDIVTSTANGYEVKLNWTADAPVPAVRMAMAMPPNAVVKKTAPGAQLTSDSTGNKYYYITVSDVKAGQTVSLNFTYAIPTASDVGGSTNDDSVLGGGPSPLLVILVIGVIAVIVLAVVVIRQNRRAAGVVEESEESEEEDAEYEDDTAVEDDAEAEEGSLPAADEPTPD